MVILVELLAGLAALVGVVILTRILVISRARVVQAKLEQSFEGAKQRLQEAQLDIARLQAQLQESVRAQALYQGRIESLEEARATLKQSLQSISTEVFQANNQGFLTLAKQTFAAPLQERLHMLDQQIQSLEKSRIGAYYALQEQVKQLFESQTKLCEQTIQLGQALKNPQSRGQWGEMQLRRVVEIAGMLEQVDFYTQETMTTDSKSIRPDMRVTLPQGRCVFVDAKAPLGAYLEASETTDTLLAKERFHLHAKQLKDHVIALSAKEYWRSLDSSPEFVILFLPGEAFLSAALQEDPSLMEYGVKLGVFIATPITLIALLKSIAYGWTQVSLAQDAQKIVDSGRELYDRLTKWMVHFSDLRRALDSTVKCYNKSLGSFENRILPSARRLKDLGIRSDQDLNAPKSIHLPDEEPIVVQEIL